MTFLDVRLAGVELTSEGQYWISQQLKPAETVWLRLIARQNETLHCLVSVNRVSEICTRLAQGSNATMKVVNLKDERLSHLKSKETKRFPINHIGIEIIDEHFITFFLFLGFVLQHLCE